MNKEILVPDIGDFSEVEVIEVLVSVGDHIQAEDSLITLESDKATMEVPAPLSGIIKEIKVKEGDRVSEGSQLIFLEAEETAPPATPAPPETATPPPPSEQPAPEKKLPLSPSPHMPEIHKEPPPVPPFPTPPVPPIPTDAVGELAAVHASPSVRRFARELGADLRKMSGSGPKGRILKEDVQAYIKGELGSPSAPTKAPPQVVQGIPEVPPVDFSQFGEIEPQPLSRIKKISGPNLQRSWLNAPQVTQFDEADITNLEAYRNRLKTEGEKHGVKITLLSFLMKACVSALKKFPDFNSSLAPNKEQLILKKYYHLGIAVDTPEGLVVPVIRNVDRKGLLELANELGTLSQKAREKKLTPHDLQGASFTISSLGGIGGTAFSPIVNVPEVAILGVSRASMKPIYQNEEFVPRLMLPLSLSYDHRVIDGAAGTRFTRYLTEMLSDERNLLL